MELENKPYLRRVQNDAEELVRQHLQTIASNRGWRVYAGLKLTDVVDPRPPEITPQEWNRATRQHLDFVITDGSRMPIFAVELDGRSHLEPAAITLDAIKDRTCAAAKLGLLRIESKFLHMLPDGRSVIEYLVDAHEMARQFGRDYWVHKCTEHCNVHPDKPECVPGEVTDYRHYGATLKNGRINFPNVIVTDARRETMMAALEGLISSSLLSRCTFVRRDGWIEAWGWLPARPEGHLFQTVRIRGYSFLSLDPCSLAMDLCWINIAHYIQKLRRGEPVITPSSSIVARFEALSASQLITFPDALYHCADGSTWNGDHYCLWPVCLCGNDPSSACQT